MGWVNDWVTPRPLRQRGSAHGKLNLLGACHDFIWVRCDTTMRYLGHLVGHWMLVSLYILDTPASKAKYDGFIL